MANTVVVFDYQIILAAAKIIYYRKVVRTTAEAANNYLIVVADAASIDEMISVRAEAITVGECLVLRTRFIYPDSERG